MSAGGERSVPNINPDLEKVSDTAKLTAYLRAFSDIPYSQEIAQATRSGETFYKIGGESMIPLASIIEARFKGVSAVVGNRRIKNILEIACGISPRGLVLTKDPSVTYVETDLPTILSEKEGLVLRILAESGESRPNLHFCEVNVLEIGEVLSASGVLSRPMAVVSEGLFQYLKRDQKLVAARNIRQVLAANGIWITADFLTKSSQDEMLQGSEVKDDLKQLSKSVGTNVEGNVFSDEAEIAYFFDETGFEVEEFDLSNLMQELSSINKSGADAEQIMRILRGRKVYILIPRN